MADGLSTLAVNDIVTKVRAVAELANKVVPVYDTDDLLSRRKRLGKPAIGVLYVGMLSRSEDQSKTGAAVNIIVDVLVIDGDDCDTPVSGVTGSTTELLDSIRNGIMTTLLNQSGARRKWKFVNEVPTDLGEGTIAYVQRWSTPAIVLP